MKEIYGSLWHYYGKPKYQILITTNGFVRNDGKAVMGRGCAAEAARRFPNLPKRLGTRIKKYGNTMRELYPNYHTDTYSILTFPVKHEWYNPADPELIRSSALALKKRAEKRPDVKFILPRPGCGNGQLFWEDVKPLLADLPDNVLVITWRKDGD